MGEPTIYGGARPPVDTLQTVNASRALAGLPPLTLAEYRLYVVGPAPWQFDPAAGDYDAEATYAARAAVRYRGGLWLAVQANTGIAPGSDSDYWTPILGAGDYVYPSRSAAMAAELAGDQNILRWYDGGRLLEARKADADEENACITTNGGAYKFSPASNPHALHYGLGAPAVMRMMLDIDRGEFKYPHDLGENLEFDKPVEFRVGAYLNIALGATATFRRMIYAAPDEWILRGEGAYTMEALGAGGVNARNVWATWGGVRSSPDNDEDMAPYMTKLCQSVGGTENIINVLHGRYALNTPVGLLPRGTDIRCAGERRTVWSVGGDDFDVFTTGGDLFRISECNFELGGGLTWRESKAFIRINHAQCKVENVRLGPGNLNVDVNGEHADILGVSAFWGESASEDSSLVRIRKSHCKVVGVKSPTTTAYAPGALVHVGGEGAGGIDSTFIDDVFTRSPGISVLLDATSGHIRDVQISNLRDYITSGAPEALVKMRAGLGVVENVRIDNWRANSRHVDAIVAHAEGANIAVLNVGQGRASGNSGAGVKLVADEGRSISGVVIGDDADIYGRAAPILKTGLGTIAKPTVMPQNGPARIAALGMGKQVTLADQSVYVVPMGVGVFNGSIEVTSNQFQTPKGKWAFRAGPSPFLQPFPTGVIFPELVELSTSEMTGTNGTDGVMTVSVTSNGTFYLQNRLNVGDVSFYITILQGIANFEFPSQ